MENDLAHPASVLIGEVREKHPDIYDEILNIIKPHKITAIERILKDHLDNSTVDLNLFNERRDSIAEFIIEYVRRIRKNFPTPGDAAGIESACRLTRNDTQDLLDSRHPKSVVYNEENEDAVMFHQLNDFEKSFRYEFNLYKNQTQFLEITCKRKFSSVYIQNYSVDDIFSIFPFDISFLNPVSMKVIRGHAMKFARFIIIEEPSERKTLRIFYHQHHSRDLSCLLKHFDPDKIEAFNDLRLIYNKLGPTCFFHNAEKILNKYFKGDPQYHLDMIIALKNMIASGRLIGYNRNGLARHPDRSAFEKLGFEAPKNTAVNLSTRKKDGHIRIRNRHFYKHSHPVKSSMDNMFFANTFKHGTGYTFSVTPRKNLFAKNLFRSSRLSSIRKCSGGTGRSYSYSMSINSNTSDNETSIQ